MFFESSLHERLCPWACVYTTVCIQQCVYVCVSADCNCYQSGSKNSLCNATGYCKCKTGVTGRKCDQCLPGYSWNDDGCKCKYYRVVLTYSFPQLLIHSFIDSLFYILSHSRGYLIKHVFTLNGRGLQLHTTSLCKFHVYIYYPDIK